MATISGMVESKSRKGTGIKVQGQWYNGEESMLANVPYQSQVTFEADGNRKILSVGASAPTPASGGGGGGSNSYDARQGVIVFQSARNAAIELYDTLVAQGAVVLPTKKEEKYAASMAFINEHTVLFHNQAMSLYEGASAEESVEVD